MEKEEEYKVKIKVKMIIMEVLGGEGKILGKVLGEILMKWV